MAGEDDRGGIGHVVVAVRVAQHVEREREGHQRGLAEAHRVLLDRALARLQVDGAVAELLEGLAGGAGEGEGAAGDGVEDGGEAHTESACFIFGGASCV